MYKLLVCDLDGTLLGDGPSLSSLMELLGVPGAPVLAFATGRQGFSATALLSEWNVTRGAYLIAGVGTEIYRRIGKRWTPVAAWPQLDSPWDGVRARRRLAALPGLQPQRIAANSAYKLSYFAPPDAVAEVSTALREAGLEATVVHSHGNLLDVLPHGIDKGSAVAWLAHRLGVRFEDIVTCGDTANDMSMLQLPCPSIVVGNCDEQLRAIVETLPNTYLARRWCAGGVIEGMKAFGWLKGCVWK